MIIHDLINEFCISYSAFDPWTRAEGELLSKSKASWPFGFWFLAFVLWRFLLYSFRSALCGAQGCTERYKRERERNMWNMWNMWMQFWRTHGNVWKCRLGLVCCVLSCVSWSPFQMPFMPVASASLSHSGKCSCESTGAARCPFFAGQVWEVPLQSGFFKDGVCECSFAACLALYYCTGYRHVASDEFPSSNFLIAMTLYVESCLRGFNFFNEFWNVIFLWSKHRQPIGVCSRCVQTR